MGNALHLGIDIGGTKINAGIVDEAGKICASRQFATRTLDAPRDFIAHLCANLKAFVHEHKLSLEDISFIGAGVPGTVDTHGFVEYCPNLGWIDEPIGGFFKEYLERDVMLIQDSRAAALAEMLFGAGRDFSDFICITLGTGIGCGVILGRKLFRGGMNTAGEIGHMPINIDGRHCVCGMRGCLEQYASASAFARRALEAYPQLFQNLEPTTKTLFSLAHEGNAQALRVIGDCVRDLAFGLAVVVDVLSPQAIIVSGGLCEQESLVLAPLREKIQNYGYFAWTRRNGGLQVLKAQLAGEAPMIGAALMYKGL